MNHCCDLMCAFLEDKRINVFYDEVFREYYTKLRGGGGVLQRFFYCPWCGKKLPDSLRSVYHELLWEKFGDDVDIEDMDIPIEFKTSLWWDNADIDLEYLIEKYKGDDKSCPSE